MWNLENGSDDPICKVRMETQMQIMSKSTWVGGGMNWEIGIGIRTWPCVEQRASGNLLPSTLSSAQDSSFLIGLSASVFAPDRVSSTGHPQASFQHLSQISYM